jgi:prepilin-type N-terminal cleavage/methylation domain-containing protein
MSSPIAYSRRSGFTLIELLVVISIIAILAGLLFPAVQGALEAAKKTQAKNDATQIATAITAYMGEYGKLPTGSGSGNLNGDNTLVNILSGQDETANPRKITFLEVPNAKNGANGAEGSGGAFSSGYKDPWKNVYEVRVDDDYDEVITDTPDGSQVRKSVIVWSKGNPAKTKDFNNPKKYIKSWE